MILGRDLKEAFRRSSLHPSSEHYIHGEFTHFLETRRLTLTILFDISTWLKKLFYFKRIMPMGSGLINYLTK
uniref:Uncharacterized protein n=1 Tax=Lepeophtheirus salmonis TaxID=72036 RepID=A0A0K2USW5_LEPSM